MISICFATQPAFATWYSSPENLHTQKKRCEDRNLIRTGTRSKHEIPKYMTPAEYQFGYVKLRLTMGSARLYIYLVLIMSIFPNALDAMISGLTCKATFIIEALVLGLCVRSMKGPEMIMLPISSRMRTYASADDASMFRRNSIENARPVAADANTNIRTAAFAHTRRHTWRSLWKIAAAHVAKAERTTIIQV